FVALGEATDATVLAQAAHALAPAGEDLVGIALVADVPDETVAGRVEHVVERDGEFDRSQVGRQVPAGAGYRVDDKAAQLIGQLREAIAAELSEFPRIVDGLTPCI